MRSMLTGVTIIDDHGARYALRGGRGSGRVAGSVRFLHLRVEPVPGRDAEWIELRSQDGTTARLLSSPRAGRADRSARARPGNRGRSCPPRPARRRGPKARSFTGTSELPCPSSTAWASSLTA